MTRSEVILKLRQDGFAITIGRLRQAILNGYVTPPPKKAKRGAYDFQPDHLRQMRWYLVNVKPGPKPLSAPVTQIRGENDRVWRLEREKKKRAQSRSEKLALRQRQQVADEMIHLLSGMHS